jgi:hypothetical protein
MLTKSMPKIQTGVRAFSTIKNIRAREIIDSRGNPTIEADVEVCNG